MLGYSDVLDTVGAQWSTCQDSLPCALHTASVAWQTNLTWSSDTHGLARLRVSVTRYFPYSNYLPPLAADVVGVQ